MSEYERETAFLGRVISCDGTAESRQIKARLTQAQEDESGVARAARLASALILLAVVGLGYREVLVENGTTPRDSGSFIANCFYGLGLGSLFSLVVFVALGAIYRRRANQRRDEARQFVANLLATHLPRPPAAPEAVASQETLLPSAGPAAQTRAGGDEHKSDRAQTQEPVQAGPAASLLA